MATGDQNDFTTRLLALLPSGWLPTVAPRAAAALQAFALTLANIFAMLGFVKAQTRVNTATGAWLDLAATDFFGPNGLPRLQYELDAQYRARILFNMTAPRGTLPGMAEMLTQLTGNAPVIIEPANPQICGGYATPGAPAAGGGLFAYGTGGNNGIGGTGGAGHYGSLLLPCQVFITVTPSDTGYGIFGAYGYATPTNYTAGGGYGYATPGTPAEGGGFPVYVNPNSVTGYLTNAQIYQQVLNWTPAGYTSWVRIL